MGETQQKQGVKQPLAKEQQNKLDAPPRKLKQWFIQLSFWKKIIIIFTLNTLILLVLTDAIMLVLFGKISNDIIDISNVEKEQFNRVSNTQVASSTAKSALSKMDLHAACLSQLANTYYYFSANPQLYKVKRTVLPTNNYDNLTYSVPAIYNYISNATFVSVPYFEELLPRLLNSKYDKQMIKRINIFIQSKTDKNDLSARTIPATSDFTIPSSLDISKRFSNLDVGKFMFAYPYTDSFTKNTTNKDQLIAVRTILDTNSTSYNIYLEVQLFKNAFASSLQNIYYFSSAFVILVEKVDSSYVFFTNTGNNQIKAAISNYFSIGTGTFTLSGKNYVTASVGLGNSFLLGKSSKVTNTSSDPIRCIILVQSEQIQQPAIQIQTFLENESNVLKGIVFCWSFIILLSTVALATVVGNYIFSNLKMLSTKMDQYIKDPSKFHLIVIELKELELKGILKKLSDNLIGIIEKIQVRKRERKDRINQNYHPLSVGEPKFQERQQLNDYQIMDEIKEEVRKKVEIMKRQAEQKERIQKQKVDKQKKQSNLPQNKI